MSLTQILPGTVFPAISGWDLPLTLHVLPVTIRLGWQKYPVLYGEAMTAVHASHRQLNSQRLIAERPACVD